MRKIISLLTLLFLVQALPAQQIVSIEQDTAYTSDGLEYGYYITNQSAKAVKGENYDRYELNLYVTNKSGCLKLIPFKATDNTSGTEDNEVMLAEFNCTNATGKRLTAKKGSVSAKPFYATIRVKDEQVKDKYRTESVQIGYAIRNGQTITNRIVVIVPKGEKPELNCRVIYLPDFK